MEFVLSAINEHKGSELYKTTCDAEAGIEYKLELNIDRSIYIRTNKLNHRWAYRKSIFCFYLNFML